MRHSIERFMKKIISALIFLVLPLLLAAPGFMGWQAEKTMKDVAFYINSLPAYSASWQSYNRGWFKSQGVLQVSLEQSEGLGVSGKTLELPLSFELLHGPVLFGGNTGELSLGFGGFDAGVTLLHEHESYLQKIVKTQEEGPLYQLTARMDLTGQVTLNDRWLPFELKVENTTITVDGYSGEGAIGLDRKLIYTMILPAIVVDGAGTSGNYSLHAKGMQGQLQAELASWHKAYVAPGTFDFTIKRLKYNNSSMDLSNIHINAQTKINENNTLSYFSQLSVAKVILQVLDFELNQASMDISYLNLSLDFLESYYAFLDKIPDDADAQYWQNHLGELMLNKLLPASPELKIDNVKFATPKGKFIANSSFSIEGDALKKADLNANNPMALLPFLLFDINAKVDTPLAKSLAEMYMRNQVEAQLALEARELTESEITDIVSTQAPSILEMLTLRGFILRKTNAYTLDFNYKKGQATLNDQPMPLPF